MGSKWNPPSLTSFCFFLVPKSWAGACWNKSSIESGFLLFGALVSKSVYVVGGARWRTQSGSGVTLFLSECEHDLPLVKEKKKKRADRLDMRGTWMEKLTSSGSNDLSSSQPMFVSMTLPVAAATELLWRQPAVLARRLYSSPCFLCSRVGQDGRITAVT